MQFFKYRDITHSCINVILLSKSKDMMDTKQKNNTAKQGEEREITGSMRTHAPSPREGAWVSGCMGDTSCWKEPDKHRSLEEVNISARISLHGSESG